MVPVSPSPTSTPSPVNHVGDSHVLNSQVSTPRTSLDSEEEEEETIEGLDNIRAYREMVTIVTQTSGPEATAISPPPSTATIAPVHQEYQLSDSDNEEYMDNGINHNRDDEDEQREEELFEDAPNNEMETQQSQSPQSTAGEYMSIVHCDALCCMLMSVDIAPIRQEYQLSDLDDKDYMDNGTSNAGDTEDEQSEEEVFEDVPDYEAEMEWSPPGQSSTSQYKFANRKKNCAHQQPHPQAEAPLLSMTYGNDHLLPNALH